MNFKGDFSKASEFNKSVMRPGIIYSIDRFPGNHIRAGQLDSRAPYQRIGSVLSALHSAGLTEGMEENSNYRMYEINAVLEPEDSEKSLILALGEAEKRFDNVIQKALENPGRDKNTLVKEVLSYEINVEEHRGEERLKVWRDYSDGTLNFFNEIGLVEDLENFNLTADDEDIEYLQNNIHVLL